jgi:protein-tyrosine phosphatase
LSAVSSAIALVAAPESPPRRRVAPIGLRRLGLVLVVALGVVVAANVQIMLASFVLQRLVTLERPAGVEGVANLRVVDAEVWRGARPTPEGYRNLAAAGVTTVVDLRAEKDAVLHHVDAEKAGLAVVHLPIRDGQLPSDDQIDQFLQIVREAPGTVFVHCGAGVGRTGAMVAAYLVTTGQTTALQALARNLAVGPPSLEQVWWAGTLDLGHRPPAVVVGLSRFVDAPRRLLAGL